MLFHTWFKNVPPGLQCSAAAQIVDAVDVKSRKILAKETAQSIRKIFDYDQNIRFLRSVC